MNQFSLDSHLHKSHFEEKSCRMFLRWEVSELVYLVPVWLCGDVSFGWWKWPHCPFYLDVLWDHRALLSTVAFIFRWLKARRCHIIKEISNIGETVGGKGNRHNIWPVCNLSHSLPQWLTCFAPCTRLPARRGAADRACCTHVPAELCHRRCGFVLELLSPLM